jgi:hypothetical protein
MIFQKLSRHLFLMTQNLLEISYLVVSQGSLQLRHTLEDVLELVGLVKKDNRMYIVRKTCPSF